MSTLNKKQILKLVKEFPFLAKFPFIDDAINLRYRIQDKDRNQVNLIKVEVADANTLFILPRSYILSNYTVSKDNKFVGHLCPHAYAINKRGEIFNEIQWVYKNANVFLGDITINTEEIKYIVYVEAYEWWKYIPDFSKKGLETYVGDFCNFQYNFWIYKEPARGFKHLKNEASLASNVRIENLALILRASEENLMAERAIKELDTLADLFKNSIGKQLWDCLESGSVTNLTGTFGRIKMLTLETLSRVMVTISDGVDDVSFIGYDLDYTSVTIKSIHCTVDKARDMLTETIIYFSAEKLVPNEKFEIV